MPVPVFPRNKRQPVFFDTFCRFQAESVGKSPPFCFGRLCVCFCPAVFALPFFVCCCRVLLLLVVLPRLLVVVVCRCRWPLLLVVFVCRCCSAAVLVVLVCSSSSCPGLWSLSLSPVGLGPWFVLHVISHLLQKPIKRPLWRAICPRGPNRLYVHHARYNQMPCEAP